MASQPNQVERVLIDADLLSQCRGIVRAQPGTSIWIDTDAKVAHARLKLSVAGQGLELRVLGKVDLGRVGVRDVVVVVEGEEEDVWYQRTGGGAAC